MDNRSMYMGLFTLAGLIVGWIVKNIMVWTFVGMAAGYVAVFWIPYFIRRRKTKK